MKKFLSVLLCMALFITGVLASFTGGYALFRTPETPLDAAYLMQFSDDSGAYYLQKAAADIIFYVDGEGDDHGALFTLTDSAGGVMTPRTEKAGSGQFKILPPGQGYEAGKEYTLTLNGGAAFSGNDLKDVRALTFCIEREAVEQYTYNQAVRTVEAGEITAIDEETIRVTGEVQTGDILIDAAAGEAFKIVEVYGDGTAAVETPALDEIFSDLQVYGEYTWDVNELEWSEAQELEIEESIRSSAFFDSLLTAAYAADEKDPKAAGVKVTHSKNAADNTVTIEIEINLQPGRRGLFGISKLKNQEVTITLETVTGFTVDCNIDGPLDFAFDLSATQTNEFSWTVGFAFYTGENKKETNAANAVRDLAEYSSIVSDLTKELANVVKDRETGEIHLLYWPLPVPAIPLLSFDAEVLLFAELETAAELTLGGHSVTRNTAGIRFKDGDFRTYSDEYRSNPPLTLTFVGTLSFKAGIRLRIRAKIVSEKVAYISLTPEAGLYAQLFATYPIAKAEELSEAGSILGLYGYFESGLYFGADFKAAVNLVAEWYEYEQELMDKKAPLVKVGSEKIAVKIAPSRASVRALNNSFTPPDILFEHYDVKSGRMATELLDIGDVKFTVDGTELERGSGNSLKLPAGSAASFHVNASYKNKNDSRAYSTIFKVVVSGSEIEGRVSAYTSGQEYTPIPGATVRLYSAGSPGGEPLGTATCDTAGKFSFNVGEGRYILKISAQGYRELTTLQEIAKDETKFTEHILLVDNEETGNGTAGGRVMNAIDGQTVSGVQIRLREGWNSRSGDYYRDLVTETGSDGQYSLDGLPVGYYTVEASKDGFYTDYCNVIVHATDPQHNQNLTISPILPENQIRIVLRWGETPSDLDSHLIGRGPDGSSFNVYYGDKHYVWSGEEMANLDVDDTTSYGPETITILHPLTDGWVYAVHDFTNRGSTESDRMSYSGAQVTVFAGGRQVAAFSIPVGQIGTYWTVFEYAGGQIWPINAVNNTKPGA